VAIAATVTTSSVVFGPPGPCTVSRKVSVVDTAGAVKLAIEVLALASVTAGVPATWAHEKPVAFSDPDPSSWTGWPCCTVSAAGACA
jgi:hypothetical protein